MTPKVQFFLALLSLVNLFISIVCFPVGSRLLTVSNIFYGIATFFVILSLYLFVIVSTITGEGLTDAVWYYVSSVRTGAYSGDLAWLVSKSSAAFMGITVLSYLVLRKYIVSIPRHKVLSILCITGALLLTPISVHFAGRAYSTITKSKLRPDEFKDPVVVKKEAVTKNLILIYAEGFERTFFDETIFPGLVPNLKLFAKGSYDFSNIFQIPSQGYTMAGIVSSQTGVPFFPSYLKLGNSTSGSAIYPGAHGMNLFLKNYGYHSVFLGGASIKFAGKGKFLSQNGYDEVLGLEELQQYKGNDRVDGWGLYDDTLIRIARTKLSELRSTTKPFCLTLLTLDTHFPYGRLPESLSGLRYADGKNLMLNAVHASDLVIGSFVNFIRATDKFNDTVIVVLSDHLAMQCTATPLLMTGNRKNLFLINDPAQTSGMEISSAGTGLDVPVTILERLGFSAALGAGRDLTQYDRSGFQISHLVEPAYFDKYSEYFLSLWEYPALPNEAFYIKNNILSIKGREFIAPMLVTVRSDLGTKFFFEIDSDKSYASISTVYDELYDGSGFFYFGSKESVPSAIRDKCTQDDNMALLFGEKNGRITYLGVKANQDAVIDLQPLIHQLRRAPDQHMP